MRSIDMRSMRFAFLFAVNTLILMALPGAILAQGVDDQMLLHPPADSWPGYHGDYSGRRHSPLAQITPENVKNLSLAWAFQTNQAAQIKSSPLMVDGILYFTVPDNIWPSMRGPAIRSGTTLIRRRKVNASDIAVWRCTRNGCTLRHRMLTLSR